MKTKKQVLILMLVTFSLSSLSLLSYAGIYKKVSDYKCVETYCAGALLLDTDNEPWPEGCTKDGDDCAGNCYRTKNSTATNFCSYDEDEDCYIDTTDKVLSCGDKYQYDCGGTWASHCSCPTTGGTDTGEDGYVTKCDPDLQ